MQINVQGSATIGGNLASTSRVILEDGAQMTVGLSGLAPTDIALNLGAASFSNGDLTVRGENLVGTRSSMTVQSGLTLVGDVENGVVLVDGGLWQTGDVILGNQSGSSGDVTIRGTGGEWVAGNIQIGSSGAGDLLVEQGGVLTAAALTLGDGANSLAVNSGAAATFGGALDMVDVGSSTVSVDGGSLQATDAVMGTLPAALSIIGAGHGAIYRRTRPRDARLGEPRQLDADCRAGHD